MEDPNLSGSLSPTNDFTDEGGEFKRSLADILQPRRDKELDRPDISHLDDAILKDPLSGLPDVRVRMGDRIVIERRSYVLKESPAPWLDTRLWYVNGVDRDRGVLKLFDEELQQHGADSFVFGLAAGQVYKLAPKDGRRWDVAPKKKRVPAPAVVGAPAPTNGEEPKKKRGRPKGSKNRSRDEVAADKAQKVAVRAARKAARLARRK